MRADVIVLAEPLVDDSASLVDTRKPVSIEDLAIMEQAHHARGSTRDGEFGSMLPWPIN
jgi:hypothetical protein